MTAATKRAWRLSEFPAHGATVNCASIGQTTGRVMVTGGDDRKVNVWTIGKPNVILTLTGHTSAVEAVRLDTAEEKVVTGSRSGTLKVWDLEQQKVLRTLSSHKANIRCLDVHPFGDFVVSGSSDTFVKVWDVRRKGCIFTYNGHTDCVNCLRVSPDGRWVASCSNDNTTNLWDLTAGRLFHSFADFQRPVEWLEFHPNEFLLAACGADRTSKFWDLETLQVISSTELESSAVRCIKFHPDGGCLFSAGQDSLRVHGWEPSESFDMVPISWGKVADMSIVNNQLVAASLYQTLVSVWVADVQRLKPFAETSDSQGTETPKVTDDQKRGTHNRIQSGRRLFTQEKPKSPPTTYEKDTNSENNENAAPVTDDHEAEIFKPRESLEKTPQKKFDPFSPPPEDAKNPVLVGKQSPSRPKTTSTTTKSSRVAADSTKHHDGSKQASLDAEEFLQGNRIQKPESVQLTTDAAIKKLENGHLAMSTVLSQRCTHLQKVRSVWSTDNVKVAVRAALDQDDDAVIIDLLGILRLKLSLWSLEICNLLLPKLHHLLSSKHGSYVLSACSAVKLVLRNFAPVIRSNLSSPPSEGIDFSREERYSKCRTCNSLLQEIRRTAVERHSHVSGKLGSAIRELKVAFAVLDS
ncbi:katanin p80 WD40 repeat-containing subunit B1-like [Corticium candelabrum]|uniref:katanin p80 WD40 repeat-containing subunit B1-like n=1 Tax=Corticium candelabrum TaxID=121492 RepID=UPI002E275275|nr:katanin p80 WD40 repeat-containing subunit B1-like [Corticium candelabrum]